MQKVIVVLACLVVVRGNAAEQSGSIDGTVTDGAKPVPHALVAAIAAQKPAPTAIVRTDEHGKFHLTSLPSGTYGVTATAEGHTAGFTLDVVVDRGSARADVKLGGESILLSGTIIADATGRPLKDTKIVAGRVSAVEGDLFAADVVEGRFRVLLPRASYELRAYAPGYAEERRSVRDASTDVTLRLTRAWPAGPPAPAVVDWLRAHAVPLTTVEAGNGFDDLSPLAAAIGDARIVGLGEATHGTREFFQLKHRLLEWLVSERGFDLFGVEANMPEAFDLNEYVLTGRGDPRKALAGLYRWVSDTEEVLDLIRWMRRWNEDPKHRQVKFYGFDMLSAPRAAKTVFDYLTLVAPREVATLTAPLMPLRHSTDAEAIGSWRPDEKESMKKAAQAVLDRFDASRAEWSARSTPDAWAVSRQHARVLVQFLGEFLGDTATAGDRRDEAMAENVGWILGHEGPRSKIVLWAHDGHVAHGSQDPTWHPMGQFLTRTWGKAYVVVGLGFDHGSFRARDADDDFRLHSFTVGTLPESFDATLHATSLPRFVIDLRAPATGIVSDWLGAKHAKRDFGALFSNKWAPVQSANPTVMAREFDLVAFVDETTAARGLPEGNGDDFTVLSAPANVGFEERDGGKLRVWKVSPQLAAFGWTAQSSSDNPFHGSRCALVRRLPGVYYGEKDGNFTERIDATAFRGKRVRLSGAVRAEIRGGGGARLVLSTILGTQPGPSNTMREHPAVDPRWHTYSIELDVPSSATKLEMGGAVVGDGSACFDDFKIETVATP